MNNIHVSELQPAHLPQLADYWFTSPSVYLESLGVDVQKLPSRADFIARISEQIALSPTERNSFALVWQLNGAAVGHANLNPFVFAKEGYLHLHLWQGEARQQGLGMAFLQQSLPIFFESLQLQQIICEPYGHNPAPNALLAKAGFTFVKTYRTIPGSINFEQEVHRWQLKRTDWAALQQSTPLQ